MLQVWRAAALVVIAALGIGHSPITLSQPYPTKPIRMLVGFAPGGSTDTVARIIAPKLSERLGQQVVVENRGGAAGNIAAELTARAAPDGYTVFMASASHTINASLYRKLPFDPVKDFVAVTLVTSSPFVLVTHRSVPAKSVRELIALAKSRPGELNYGSGGATSHLATELFSSMAGIKVVHIPYKSSGPAATDLLGGQIAMMLSAPPAALPHVQAGRLRALGVTGSRRLSGAADIPTIAESGLPGYEVNSWSGLLAPAATPKEIIMKINVEMASVMTLPDVKDRLPSQGLEATTNTPEQFVAYIRAEIEKWAKVVGAADMRADLTPW